MSFNGRTDNELAKLIARAVFEAPSGLPGPDPVHRIAFMGGKYPDAETNLGGFCEEALVECIERVLEQYRTY